MKKCFALLFRCVMLGFLSIAFSITYNAFPQTGPPEEKVNPELTSAITDAADSQGEGEGSKASQKQVPSDKRKQSLPADLRDNVDAYIDVLYGKTVPEFQTLDAFIVKSDKPTPVLLEVHSGGFSRKTKSRVFVFDPDGLYMQALRAGISVISIDYRLSPQYAFPAHAEDVARAIQFIRSKAQEWTIDPARIASSGGSAGAFLSMWVAFHDDMANPASKDPVERYSTRLSAVVEWNGPVDFRRMTGNMSSFIGGASEDYNKTEESKEKLRIAAPIEYVTPDDPPVILVYKKDGDVPLTAEVPAAISGPHTFWWGILLAQALEANHVPHEVLISKLSPTEKTNIEVDFLKKHLFEKVEDQDK